VGGWVGGLGGGGGAGGGRVRRPGTSTPTPIPAPRPAPPPTPPPPPPPPPRPTQIDGLAPVRSSKQDQIHNSIVSTLLALMDGLDARGRVVVIGATNRPDALDGALRRPGRFDRELLFPLPNRFVCPSGFRGGG
jgi:hypothetical protein